MFWETTHLAQLFIQYTLAGSSCVVGTYSDKDCEVFKSQVENYKIHHTLEQ